MTSVPKAQHNLEPKVSKLSKSLLFGYGMKKKVERAFTSLRRGGNCEETSSHSLLSSRESIAAWHRKNVNVYDFYEVIDVIGHGQMGEVSMVKRKPKAWDKVMKRANNLSSVPLDDLEDRLSVSLHNKTLSLRDELGSSDADISNTRKLSVTLHNNYKLPSSMNAEGTSSVKSHSYNTLLGGSSGSRKKPISREEEYRDSFLRHYACKTVSTTRIKAQDLEVFLNEVSIMRKLDHPNIVQLYEIYSTRRKMWLITELCYGGEFLLFIGCQGETIIFCSLPKTNNETTTTN
jgi:serine/threonine protein kinase